LKDERKTKSSQTKLLSLGKYSDFLKQRMRILRKKVRARGCWQQQKANAMKCGSLQNHFSKLLVAAITLSLFTGCSAGKLTMPKLAFWKKDDRLIASHPPEQLPSSQTSPDTGLSKSFASKSNKDDGLPGDNFPSTSKTPTRKPYSLPEINDDSLLADKLPSTNSVKPDQNSFTGQLNPSRPFEDPKLPNSSGTKLNNPYMADSKNRQVPESKLPQLPRLSENNSGGGSTDFSPNQEQFQLPKADLSPNGKAMSNPYVNPNQVVQTRGLQPKTTTPNVNSSNPPTTMNQSEFDYPDTGYGEYVPRNLPKTETNPLPKLEMPVVQQTQPLELPNANLPQHPGRQTSNVESGDEKSQVRTANLPPELMNVNTTYAPGSVGKPPTAPTNQNSTTTQQPPSTNQFQLPQLSSPGGGSFVPQRP
jgi:hypothetical protein